jgi:predicted NAD/FAD-binding protein
MASADAGSRVAVIGAGAAGLTAAWLLRRRHTVTLFEREHHLGGHAWTVEVDDGGRVIPLDLGFMVFNRRNYPHFTRLLEDLGGIVAEDSEMSFGYYSPGEKAGYVVNWDSRSPRPAQSGEVRDLLPGLLGDVLRFCRTAGEDLKAGRLGGLSLGDYLGRHGFPRDFAERYAIAMGSALWSTPPRSLLEFPAETFLRFFANHGMLTLTDAPQWLHIRGGSRHYVGAIAAAVPGANRGPAPVERVERLAGGVAVRTAGGEVEHFDHAVLAVHADEVLGLLANPTAEERESFSAWRYHRNDTVLHTDVTLMPPDPALWASWNYRDEGDAGRGSLFLTYHLNRLQGLRDTRRQYFLTLNPARPVPEDHVLGHYRFTHPVYTAQALAGRDRLAALNGTGRVWYCGSYFGYGFHEDAVRSSVEVARGLGVEP